MTHRDRSPPTTKGGGYKGIRPFFDGFNQSNDDGLILGANYRNTGSASINDGERGG